MRPSEPRLSIRARAVLAAIVVLGFALRLPLPGRPPPGLYRDEAYNGIDAAAVLEGRLALYFPANNGREPLFVLLAAPFVGMLGRTPAAVRLAAAFVGTIAVAGAFAAGSSLQGRRAGIVTAGLMAAAVWPVVLGRVGLRAGLLPCVLALAVAASARGMRSGDRRWVAFGGALAGLTVYTYLAAWAGLAIVAVVGAWALVRRRPAPLGPYAVWLAAAALVALPLVLRYAVGAEGATSRASQVTWQVEGEAAELVRTAIRSAAATAGMIGVAGDDIARHNDPGRPVLGFLGAALWCAGALVLVWRARRDAGAVAAIAWIVSMAVPTFLAQDSPHFLRAAGMLPAVFLPVGVALDGLAGALDRRGVPGTWMAAIGAVAVVGLELAATLSWSGRAASGELAERLHYDFETGATELAADVNRHLGIGWTGGWSAEPRTVPRGAEPDRSGAAPAAVWLDRRLRDGWASIPYLVPTEALTLTDPYDPVFTTGPGTAYLWPHDLDLTNVWSRRAPGLRIDFREGSTERGDLEISPRLLYLAAEAVAAPAVGQVTGTTPSAAPTSPFVPGGPADSGDSGEALGTAVATPIAEFGNGLVLVSAAARPIEAATALEIVTEWAVRSPVDRDVTAFVHVSSAQGQIAGDDRPLGEGRLPVPLWRVGDVVVERRRVALEEAWDPARHEVVLGLYEWPSTDRIPVVGPAHQAGASVVPVTVYAPET